MKTINADLIKTFKPCHQRLDNYLEHYGNKRFSYRKFTELKKIAHSDKVWVLVRLLSAESTAVFALDMALSAIQYADVAANAALAADAAAIVAAAADVTYATNVAYAADAAVYAAYAAVVAVVAADAARDKEEQEQLEILLYLLKTGGTR